jgi:hypothetical protein
LALNKVKKTMNKRCMKPVIYMFFMSDTVEIFRVLFTDNDNYIERHRTPLDASFKIRSLYYVTN